MALETELATYRAKLDELKADAGKFVLIEGGSVLGIFNTYEDALKDGYAKCGLKPFLVKRIEVVERTHFISRFIPPAKRAS